MGFKLALLIAMVVGAILGWVNSMIKRDQVPKEYLHGYILVSILLGAVAFMIVIIGVFALFE
jgi:hypothetical protein